MKDTPSNGLVRRRFLSHAALAGAALPLVGGSAVARAATPQGPAASAVAQGPEPFWGTHQSGIASPAQRATYFLAFDMLSNKRQDLITLLQGWTDVAAQLAGNAVPSMQGAPSDQIPRDSGAAADLSLANLSTTFGFGASLFSKDGVDRYGLAAKRPPALVDMPRFAGDQLIAERSGGDLSVQVCADDPQVCEYAIRRFAALANGVAQIRWGQTGFNGAFKAGETGRNTMGFKDGTINVATQDAKAMHDFVWAGNEGPAWMVNGSYMVVRTIRIALEHWDRMKLGFQEATIGRHKVSGAPLGKQHEFDELDLDATNADGTPMIPENSHARMSAPASNDGAQILRRGFSYDNGVQHIAERWPPWRQVMTFDSGLLFMCYQRDPRTGFIKMFENMAKFDMLNQFTTHVGSGMFACPPGAQRGEYIGQRLFDV